MYAQDRSERPTLGATFYPGRDDDFMLPAMDPEVVSPSPQRALPEVTEQISSGLQHLELEANSVVARSSSSARQLPQQQQPQQPQQQYTHKPQYPPAPASQNSFGPRGVPRSGMYSGNQQNMRGNDYGGGQPGYQNQPPPHHHEQNYPQYGGYEQEIHYPSPFPRLVNPGPMVPPSFEEKELIVEQSRVDVLSSNDPELQLTWAYDALQFVEISLAHMARISDGERPDTPELEHQIKTDAINVVSFLADQHHPRAEFMKGNWLEFGKFGFRVDKKEAFKSYARAAERGYSRAEYRMGMQFENSNEPMKAIKHYNQGAAMGDSASNYRLGMMTLLGQHGQKQDYARGVYLIRLAAQNADENAPQGAYVYGMLLARELPGITVPEVFLPPNIQLAREMIEKAAFLGFARAQLKMGTAYELCQLGCEFNPALSLHYNALAAKQGEPEAEMAISKWFLCGHEGVFEKNEELAFVYAQRAASSQLATAEFALGYFYEIGMYVQVDLQQAKMWYGKAAAHGNKDASSRIEGISRSKTLSRKDHERVAVSRIRAQRASMRYQTNPLTDRKNVEAVDMPDPTIPDVPPLPQMPQLQGGQFPARTSSRGPGPVNAGFINPEILAGAQQGPGGFKGGPPPPRPGTTAPYPEEMTAPGMNAYPPRAASAAGFQGPGGPQGRPFSPPGSHAPHQRPHSGPMGAHANMVVPAGTYPPNHLGPNGQRAMTATPGGQRPGPPRGPPGGGSPQMQQQPYPGFEHEPKRHSGGGGGSRPGPGPIGPPPMHKPPPPMVGLGFEAPPEQPRPKPTPTPQPGPGQRPGPGGPGGPGPQSRPGPPPSVAGGGGPAPPPAATPAPPKPAPTPAPPTPKAPAKPAGPGPKTFEEMGVQEAKKEDECCIM